MSFTRATSDADWRGKKYYNGKKQLAQQLVLEENARKATENMRKAVKFMKTVLVYVLFGALLYLVFSAWYLYYKCQMDFAETMASVVVMRLYHQGEIRQMQAKTFTMEQALQEAESRGVLQLEQLQQSLTTRHDKEMEKQAQEYTQVFQEREVEFAAQLEHMHSQLEQQAQEHTQAHQHREMEFAAQLEQAHSQMALARDEKANMRTSAEAFGEIIQDELVKRQALFDETLRQQSTRHGQEMETMRCTLELEQYESKSKSLALLRFEEDQFNHPAFINPLAIPTNDSFLNVTSMNFTNMAAEYFNTVQRLQDTAVCKTVSPFPFLAEQVLLVQTEKTPAHLDEERGHKLYHLMQDFQSSKPVKEEVKPCTSRRVDFWCRVKKRRQEEQLAFKPCDNDDFWCRVKASIMVSPHEYSRSALQKELAWLQKGKYSEFSWQSIHYYTKIQQFELPGFLAKQYPNEVDQLQQQR